jgi:anti-anti-sigma regulatory factor
VDLKGVRHINGSGVASLVEAYHYALCKGIGFSLAAPSRQAVPVLELSWLHQVFPMCDTLGDGLARFTDLSISSPARVKDHELENQISVPA